jgi:hypothetical protein
LCKNRQRKLVILPIKVLIVLSRGNPWKSR